MRAKPKTNKIKPPKTLPKTPPKTPPKTTDGIVVFFNVLISTDIEFIKWIKLRLGFFEELNNPLLNKNYNSNGIYLNSNNIQKFNLNIKLNNNKYSLSPNILVEQFQSIMVN